MTTVHLNQRTRTARSPSASASRRRPEALRSKPVRALALLGAGARKTRYVLGEPNALTSTAPRMTAGTKKAVPGVHSLQSPNSSGVNAPHGLGADHTAEHCGVVAACVKIRSARRTMGRDLGGSLQNSSRRMTAALSRIRDVAFSFGGCPTHGLIAPAWLRFCGLMPCGHPSGWPLPTTRSANPHGVALPLGGGGRPHQSVVGATMSSTLNAPAARTLSRPPLPTSLPPPSPNGLPWQACSRHSPRMNPTR